jgi:nitrogen regulatory protein PII
MQFKLIIALINESETEPVLEAARAAGATGVTIINGCRGEGLEPVPTFLGLALESQRNVLMFLVEQHLARSILETIGQVAGFDTTPGTGIAFQVDVEDAIGVRHQVEKLTARVQEHL